MNWFRNGWLAVLLLGLTAGCGLLADATPEAVVVTEVIVFDDGAEFVVTSVFTPTRAADVPTPVPTIPLPQALVELDVGTLGSFGSTDPQRATTDNNKDLIENLYVGLTRYNESTAAIEPQLARDWTVSADGRTWLFNLRDDIWWVNAIPPPEVIIPLGDTEPDPLVEYEAVQTVTADDIVFAVERVCSRQSNIPDAFVLFVIDGCEARFMQRDVEAAAQIPLGVRALDATTLEVRLRERASYFLAITTLPIFRPIPSERIADEDIDWLDPEDLVTSGPFLLSPLSDPEAEPNPVTILQRNPLWPADLSPAADADNLAPDRVNLYRFLTSQAALDVYEEDLLDLSPLPRALIDEVVRPPFAAPPLIVNPNVFYLGFNLDSPAFSVPEVRRAFSAAIDRERLLREVYDRSGLPRGYLTPPSALYGSPLDRAGGEFRPGDALNELTNSGYTACQAIGEITYLTNSTDIALQHAESLVRMWVDTLQCDENQFKIEQVQFGTLLARTRANSADLRPDLFDLAWSGFYPDAHDYFAAVIHCTRGANRPNRSCTETDQLIEIAYQLPDPAEREEVYRRIEVDLFGTGGEQPIVPLYVEGEYQLVQDWVVPSWASVPAGEGQIIGRFNGVRYDTFLINQTLKSLERSQ